MKTFEINYYDVTWDGMRDELTKTEYFDGTYAEAVKRVEETETLWGGFYKVDNQKYGGNATIDEVVAITKTVTIYEKV